MAQQVKAFVMPEKLSSLSSIYGGRRQPITCTHKDTEHTHIHVYTYTKISHTHIYTQRHHTHIHVLICEHTEIIIIIK